VTLRVTHLGADRVVLTLRDITAPICFRSPVSPEVVETLRWLLEDCPDLLIGPERRRHQEAMDAVGRFGEQLWQHLAATDAAQAILDVLVRSPDQIDDVRFVSDDAAFLGLPWELARPPGHDGYPFLAVRALSRRRRDPGEGRDIEPRQVGPLRILLVSPRPYGDRDVAPRTVRGPILKAVSRSRDAIEVELLQPSTLQRLEEVMAWSGRFDIVHFDGHGASDGVVFEHADGSAHQVSASAFADVLARRPVPLVVLNACRSARTPPGSTVGSVAIALLHKGLPAVIAMTHDVRAAHVTAYSEALYAAIARGDTAAAAATAAVRALLDAPSAGEADAAVPRPFHTLPVLYAANSARAALAQPERGIPIQPIDAAGDDLDLLMYRDAEVTRLDRMLLAHEPIVLSGVIGCGKSRFLRTYARYCQLLHLFDEVVVVEAAPTSFDSPHRVLHIWDGVGAEEIPAVERVISALPAQHRLIVAMRHDGVQVDHQRHVLGDMGTEVVGLVFARSRAAVSSLTASGSFDRAPMDLLITASNWHAGTVRRVLHAIEREPIDAVSWRLSIGFPTGEGDPLIDADVGDALGKLDRPSLELLAMAGLFGIRVFPSLLCILTDRYVEDDPFARLTGARVTADQWLELLEAAAKVGVVQRIFDEHSGGYYLPPMVSFALRGILAERFDESALRELRRGSVAATLVALTEVYRGVMSGDDTGYARRLLRELFSVAVENNVWTAVLTALDLSDFSRAVALVRHFANHPPGSDRWKVAGLLLRHISSPVIVRQVDGVAAQELWDTVDDLLSEMAIALGDWRAAAWHLRRLLREPLGELARSQLCSLYLRGVEVMLHADGAAEATRYLSLAVVEAHRTGSAEDLSRCRHRWQLLVDDLGLGPTESMKLAVSVGLGEEGVTDHGFTVLKQLSDAEALEDLRRAELDGHSTGSILLRTFLGERARNCGDFDEARRWLKSVLDLVTRDPSLGDLARVAHDLSMVEELADNLDEAFHWSTYAIEVARGSQKGRTQADARYELGIIELKRQRLAEANAAFAAALKEYRSLGMPDYANDAHLYWAITTGQTGDLVRGIRECAAVARRLRRSGSHDGAVEALRHAALFALAQNDPSLAQRFLDLAIEAAHDIPAERRGPVDMALSKIAARLARGPE
jgi:tetratricopeptide (TPR) repeat protein